MSRKFQILFTITALILLAGCASSGKNFSWEDAGTLEKGMSPDQVQAIMGPPQTVSEDGTITTWMYHYTHATAYGSGESKMLTITFINGKMTNSTRTTSKI